MNIFLLLALLFSQSVAFGALPDAPLTTPPAGGGTLDLSITANADDAREAPGENTQIDSNYAQMPRGVTIDGYKNVFRFLGLDIPAGVVINSANFYGVTSPVKARWGLTPQNELPVNPEPNGRISIPAADVDNFTRWSGNTDLILNDARIGSVKRSYNVQP